jgi:hypothetical protein
VRASRFAIEEERDVAAIVRPGMTPSLTPVTARKSRAHALHVSRKHFAPVRPNDTIAARQEAAAANGHARNRAMASSRSAR